MLTPSSWSLSEPRYRAIATLVSVLVASAGGMYMRLVAAEGISASTWALSLPETFWVVWGLALFTTTMAYHERRREACEDCGGGAAAAAAAA